MIDLTLKSAANWLEEGRDIALATVVQTWGSAPQPVGSQLLIDSDGSFLGSVSGGCVEGAVITEAVDVIESGKPMLMKFGVADETAWELGLACGGKISVFVESIDEVKAGFLKEIVKAQRNRLAVAMVTDLASGEARLVPAHESDSDPLASELANSFRFDKSGVIGDEDGIFINVFNPALKLVVIGAVHIAQALVPIAQLTGYDVTVIDPRGAFASEARFENVQLFSEWPDEVLDGFDLDARTAFVALTHDPKIDDPALRIALANECFYIGALGSRRTHAGRLERLQGVENLERIDGPIGLDIGGRGAPEIAISIMAKMTSALRQGS
ncbi:Xanthine and CO dehydrogenases maturation factor, XdhC/CoxF family [hydrothermal vent metagenome]|uniref:Xanthine and CO dehydrogenases maturation factor, XdhC/CoxF family n=1 Tax=hydrothermal vent metagenome TaxID=652676 RepID=A0A3B0RN66_9ZZZZ